VSLLLDTHVALWGITADSTLDDEFLDRLRHDPDIFLSTVTLWEITIKQTAGKLGGPPDLAERVRDWDSGNCRSPIHITSAQVGSRFTTVIRLIACSSHRPGSRG
jgi:PIN domain nuclease of toxin-antitoxin system